MSDMWPGGFASGDRVEGIHGTGTVSTRAYCLGRGLEFKGKRVDGIGIQPGAVPVIFDTVVGHFWCGPMQLKRTNMNSAAKAQDERGGK